MKDIFYVINLDKLKEIFNDYVESVEERMIETEVNETYEWIEGNLILTRKDVKKQLVTNEAKNKLNQVITHCLELLLIDKETILSGEEDDLVVEENESKSDSYLLAIRTLLFYKILEQKN